MSRHRSATSFPLSETWKSDTSYPVPKAKSIPSSWWRMARSSTGKLSPTMMLPSAWRSSSGQKSERVGARVNPPAGTWWRLPKLPRSEFGFIQVPKSATFRFASKMMAWMRATRSLNPKLKPSIDKKVIRVNLIDGPISRRMRRIRELFARTWRGCTGALKRRFSRLTPRESAT